MAFVEDVLPVDVAPGASGGPMFHTTVKRLRSGAEFRNRLWQNPLRDFVVRYNSRTIERIESEIQKFVFKIGGAHLGFRARDWSDYTATDEQVGVGDGTTFYFRLTKSYGTYERRILKPDPATVTIKLNGVAVDADNWAIDGSNGVVIFLTAPGMNQIVTWSGEFHVPIRFDDDMTTITTLTSERGTLANVPLREVRVREVIDEDLYDQIRDYLDLFDKTELVEMLDILDTHVNINWPGTSP